MNSMDGRRPRGRKIAKLASIVGGFGFGFTLLAGVTGCSNPETPAGHEGYVYSRPIAFGHGGFVETMTGPRKYGISWRKYVTNVDMRPTPFTATYTVRMEDELNVEFDVTVKAGPTPGKTKELIETVGEDWYGRIAPQVESISRKTIARYESEGVQGFRDKMSQEIWHGFSTDSSGVNVNYNGIDNVVSGLPITIYDVVVGNIDFPDAVEAEIEAKIASQQKYQRKGIERRIATEDAAIRVEQAKGIAEAQKIINATLTSAYLQHEAIETAKELAGSDNTTFYFVPTSTDGMGMPLVLSPEQTGK